MKNNIGFWWTDCQTNVCSNSTYVERYDKCSERYEKKTSKRLIGISE